MRVLAVCGSLRPSSSTRDALSLALAAAERGGAEVGYVKTGEGLEVDFLARRRAGGEELIQACADLSSPETRARELRALTAAAKDHPRATRRLLVLNRDALKRADASGIEVLPAYEWLLAAPDES